MADNDPDDLGDLSDPDLPVDPMARPAERGDVQALLSTMSTAPVGWVHTTGPEPIDSSYVTLDSALDMVIDPSTVLTWSRDRFGHDLVLEFGADPAIRLGIPDPSRRRTETYRRHPRMGSDSLRTLPAELPAEEVFAPELLGDLRVPITATMPAEHWFFLRCAVETAADGAHEHGQEWERIAGEIALPVTGLTWKQVTSPRDLTTGLVAEIIARVGTTDPVALTAALLAAGFTPPAVSPLAP